MPVSPVTVWSNYEDTLTNTLGGDTETAIVSVHITDALWAAWQDVTWEGPTFIGAKAAYLLTAPAATETYSGLFYPIIKIWFLDVEDPTADWIFFDYLTLWFGNPTANGGNPRIFAYLKGRTIEWKVTAEGGFAGVETYHWTGFNLSLVPSPASTSATILGDLSDGPSFTLTPIPRGAGIVIPRRPNRAFASVIG